MSAKGRKPKTEAKVADQANEFHPTPSWCVRRLLEHVELPGGKWLEPAAGDGAIIRAVNDVRKDVLWRAVELRSAAFSSLVYAGIQKGGAICADFLRLPPLLMPETQADVVLTNPPFSLAADFVLKSLQHAEQVVMLLRLNFLGSSNSRRHLFETAGNPDVYVLSERPSFSGEGTDSCEYAWMRWIRGGRQKSEVRVLFEKSQLPMFGAT